MLGIYEDYEGIPMEHIWRLDGNAGVLVKDSIRDTKNPVKRNADARICMNRALGEMMQLQHDGISHVVFSPKS